MKNPGADLKDVLSPRNNTEPVSDDVARAIPTFATVKSGLYRHRQKSISAIPNSRDDVDRHGTWASGKNGENFVLASDGTMDLIVLFGTDRNVDYLCKAEKIFCDGTFYASPKQFKQIYTLHAFVEGQMFPLIYGLLPDKTQATYTRMFRLLKDAAEARGMTLNPPAIQLDFEKAAHNAASDVFPGVVLKGCFFHYGQCIWRNVQQQGLTTTYQSDHDLYRFVRRAAVLPLVPPALVDDVWLQAMADSPDTVPTRAFADNVTETWLEGTFDRDMWNHFNTNGARTTNHLEGWHQKLNRLTKKAHPNIFEFISVIQTEQAANEVKILQLEGRAAPPRKRSKYVRLDQRLLTLKQTFESGEKTVIEYADAASYLLSI